MQGYPPEVKHTAEGAAFSALWRVPFYARYNFVDKIPRACGTTASLLWFSSPKIIRLRHPWCSPWVFCGALGVLIAGISF